MSQRQPVLGTHPWPLSVYFAELMIFFLLLISNTKVREFPSFQVIRGSMKNTKGLQTYSEPDVRMWFTAKISNAWAQIRCVCVSGGGDGEGGQCSQMTSQTASNVNLKFRGETFYQ